MLLTEKDPFGHGKWQDFLNQIAFLKENNLTIADVPDALAKSYDPIAKTNTGTVKICPVCQSPMQLLPVNDTPATQTGDDSKCVWLCRQCGEAIYSTKTIEEEMKCLTD